MLYVEFVIAVFFYIFQTPLNFWELFHSGLGRGNLLLGGTGAKEYDKEEHAVSCRILMFLNLEMSSTHNSHLSGLGVLVAFLE